MKATCKIKIGLLIRNYIDMIYLFIGDSLWKRNDLRVLKKFLNPS